MKEAPPTHRLRKGALAVLVAAIAALSAFAVLPAMSAQAGPPPSVTATPNPVIVPAAQTTGSYTLSWVLGGMGTADFYVATDGGADVGPFTVTGNVGSNPANIDVNTTQVWTMYYKGDHGKPLANVSVTARHLDASCEGKKECVKLANVVPHGTFGQFHVITTHVLKSLELEVHRPGQASISSKSINPNTTDWQPTLSGLTPDTLFDWSLKATDESGNVDKKTGSFTTLHRKVTVTYNPIHVIDDSDDLSEGDLKFWFGFATQMDTNAWGEVGVDSGDNTNPNHTSVRMDAPDTVGLVVHGQDNDCWGWGPCFLVFETPATGPEGHGSTSDEDWATATTTVNVAHDGPGESFSGAVILSTTSFELQFSVKATFSVTYV